ncbi:permease-like cell division protein FtsX [Dokdonella sp.]|uniref:permease-like cell division protein FtsX n=1 Tax=Dokdonella sp. TaxID=2291710 RepID=UPI0031BE0218|nr:permease-like cell division protein FtsX [Dokdonella sp.]
MVGKAPRRTGDPATTPDAAPRAPRRRWRERAAAWRDQHLYSFFSSLGRLAARPFASALTVLVLGLALALPLLFWLAFDNARHWSGGLREARDITVFLDPAADAPAAQALAAELRGRADVAAVLVRTPEQGLAEFRQLAGFGAALDAMADNPLPSVLVVTPAASAAGYDPPLVGELRGDARIDLVQYDATWGRKLTGILEFGERLVTVLAALLAAATVLVIGNTVRMDIQTRREEVSVMQLIGASDGFVRRPFLYAGLWYGLLGALLALAVVGLLEFALAAPLERLLGAWTDAQAARGLGAGAALGVLAAGATLGWLGAYLVVARHLAAGRPGA